MENMHIKAKVKLIVYYIVANPEIKIANSLDWHLRLFDCSNPNTFPADLKVWFHALLNPNSDGEPIEDGNYYLEGTGLRTHEFIGPLSDVKTIEIIPGKSEYTTKINYEG